MKYQTDAALKLQIQLWFKTYGKFLMAAILLVLIVFAGWKFWQSYRSERLIQAATVYQELLHSYADYADDATLSDQSDAADAATRKSAAEAIRTAAEQLKTDYDDTQYSFFAAMLLASHHVKTGNLQQAMDEFNWVLKHSQDTILNAVVTLKLAELFWQQNQIDQAKRLLNQPVPSAFTAVYKELLGDIALATNQPRAARIAYEEALSAMQPVENPRNQQNMMQRQKLQHKLDYLTEAEKTAVIKSENAAVQTMEADAK